MEQDSPQNARTVLQRLLDSIDSLEQLPQRYTIYERDKRLRNHVRMMPVMTFLVYYRIFEQQEAVQIMSVQHGARRRPRSIG
jgi:toxin ParE1/3/4